MDALTLIHSVPEVEKRLVDDLSRQIYKLRMDYVVYKNIKKLRDNISNWDLNDKWIPNLNEFIARNNPKRIIIFGSGHWGRKTLNILKRSKYKYLDFLFCDSDIMKHSTGGGY